MKRKLFSISLTVAFLAGLILIPAAPARAVDTYNVTAYTLYSGSNGTSVWSTAQAKTGTSSVKLTHTANVGSVYVDFVPPAGQTLATFQADITNGTPVWGFWHYLQNTGVTNGPQLELYFDDPDSTGFLEVTAVGLQNYTGTDAWVQETLAAGTLAGYGGWGEAGSSASFFNWGPLTALSGIETAVNGESNVTSASDWVLTRVRVELWEDINQYVYIDDIEIDDVTYYGMIQDAIDVAGTGDTIKVYPGTYTEVVRINEEVTLTGVTTAGANAWAGSVAGSGSGPTIDYDTNAHMITIDTNNVTIQGFTIDLTDATASRGIAFRSQGAGTIDSPTIQYNTFLQDGGDRAISISDDNVVNNFTINYNRFTGHATTAGNWLAIGEGAGVADTGTNVASYNTVTGNSGAPIMLGSRDIDNITFSNNTFTQPLVFYRQQGSSNDSEFGDIVIRENIFSGPAIDIFANLLNADFENSLALNNGFEDDIIVQYNTFTEAAMGGLRTIYFDVTSPANPLDARFNYWNSATGPVPYIASNVRDTLNPGAQGGSFRATATGYVTYTPWLYLTTAANSGDTVANIVTNSVPAYADSVALSSGWNTFSVPIGLDGQYNTWEELYTLTSLPYTFAYRFDTTTQTFVALSTTSTYAIVPGEAFYVKLTAAHSIPYAYSTAFSMPSRALEDGFNLVGGGMTEDDEVVTLVSIATVGSTAGYTQVISPVENAATTWLWVTGDSTQGDLVVGEGYWVFLPIDRTLGLFDPTPVAWVPLP